jgi:hypothetical protein
MRELGDGGRRGTKRWDGAGGRVGSSGNGVVAAETPETPAVRNERNGHEYEGCKKKKKERDGERAGKGRCTGCTSEELAEARSGGASREAGVTLASLGLSLVNNFRMVEEEWGTKGDWDG